MKNKIKVVKLLPAAVVVSTLFMAVSSAVAQPQALPDYDVQPISAEVLSCLLEPSYSIALSSEITGVVASVNTERGERVKKNQILLRLKDGPERASLATAKAKVEFAERKVERNQDLLVKGLLSDFERDEIITELQLSKLELGEVQARINQRSIRSPIDGIVVKRYVELGEHVGSVPVLELASLNPLYAEVVMTAEQYGNIHKGSSAKIALQGRDLTVEGVVIVVDQLIDASSGTFGLRIKIDNKDLSLPAGLGCSVQFIDG